MAKDPVMGPISHPFDPKPRESLEEEIKSFEKASDEDLAKFEESLQEPRPEPALEPKPEAEVQLEDERRQTYEYELRTELLMRPRNDVIKLAEMRGLKFDPLASKGRLIAMILRAEGFQIPLDSTPEEQNVPRYSVRVRRALESQMRDS